MDAGDKVGCGAFTIVALMFLLFPIITFNGCNSSYSEGERIGKITKLSKKGHLFKSWEGEMLVGDNSIINPAPFVFSVTDENLVKSIQDSIKTSKSVTLHYNQWSVKPNTQDSEYNAISIEEVKKQEGQK